MNALVTALLTAATINLAAALPAIAADPEQTHAARGVVRSVDAGAGTAKITHDPIKSLKWPKMTMDFKAHDPVMLKDIKPGAVVDFELMKMDGGYHIMKISPSAN